MPHSHLDAGPNITFPFPFTRPFNTTAHRTTNASTSTVQKMPPAAMDDRPPPPFPPIFPSQAYVENPLCNVMNWETTGACFLSRSWQIHSNAMFAATCLGTVLLCLALEFVRRLSRTYDRAIYSRRRRRGDEREEDFDLTVWEQSVRAGIKCLEATLGVILVLLVVSFNGYVILSLLLGWTLAFWAFRWDMWREWSSRRMSPRGSRPMSGARGGNSTILGF